ncbi:hypothetical protein JIN84_17870 [Luteolibacter yonseiensis]|uniref:Uncharacterized protein n=2 Tax=Luteolibacter yonseiensis TaxID=1144680 RepID=A0A934VBP4_9BACT|nr:hypothetical protein [Luteolibacter yonseiensis]
MEKPIHRKMTKALARECRVLVYRTAEKYSIPAVFITAHVRSRIADRARLEVWRTMIGDMGMTRQLVADCFGRDRRRLRASVLERSALILHEPLPRAEKPRSKVKRRPLAPFQPVGNQFVWNFAVPLEIGPVPTIERFMKLVPSKVKVALEGDDRVRLARLYEREARMLRKC